MLVDISPDRVVSQRPLYGTLVRLPRTLSLLSLFTKDDDSAKTVPVECFLDGHVVDLFLILPPPF